jgi:PAS domain S-box-containing protein
MQNINFSVKMPWFYSELKKNKPLQGHVKGFPEQERKVLEPQGIKSLALVPIFLGKSFWGFIGYDECKYEREFTESEVSILKAISAIIGNRILRDVKETDLNDTIKGLAIQSKELQDFKIALLNVLEDVEDEKNKVLNLAKDLKKFQLAVENAYDSIIITDVEGIILYANSAAEKTTGFSIGELIGKKAGTIENWGGLMTKEYYQKMWKTIKEDKKPFTDVIDNQKKNGEHYKTRISISPVLDNNNELTYLVEVERDITEEIKLDRAKSEFLSLVSHQLRTPLSTMRWYIEMLISGDAGEVSVEQKKFLNEVEVGTLRLLKFVNALLNVSKIELGSVSIEPEPVDVELACEIAFKPLVNLIKEKNIKLVKRYPDEKSIINLDPTIFQIIIENLLSNAIKYTPVGGEVVLNVVKAKTDLLITIKDTGYGIPEEEKPRIFDKLFRGGNIITKDVEGTGLGLFIVKTLIDICGGKISFDSEVGKGTTFSVSLPLTGMPKIEGTKELEISL